MARRAPGSDSDDPWPSGPRKIWAAKNAAKEASIIAVSATEPNTTAFAPRTGQRRGTAANVERIMPVPYSPVTNSTPSTPMNSWARKKPCSGPDAAAVPASSSDQVAVLDV